MNEQELLLDCVRRLHASGVQYMLTGSNYWNRITPSDRQLGDVAGVVQVQRANLDERYLRHWAGQLGVVTELEAALSGKLKPKQT